jgi:hypothetical protein
MWGTLSRRETEKWTGATYQALCRAKCSCQGANSRSCIECLQRASTVSHLLNQFGPHTDDKT